ncbi:rhodanese-like domain-containing protein [Paracoccus sp. IB05]|uniref:rhodanese-like domain-containing protein n=1 Tax=Paracoccus sp. IB05 TaxID=2779367 RepID=UPI0018E86E39|nr:rhodanese-like domain-containing protein [Paracoccus sp. IB05]MBJ2151921.1 rhodanese-like domain-containing protein [Paracoccus sp. IB05]
MAEPREKLGYRDLLARANAAIVTLAPDEAAARLAAGDAVFVDIRDPRELEREGQIPGARHAPRGMLEFWIDADSPYHKPWLAEDRLYVFYCASGWRSALAAEVAGQMGLTCASLGGGFTAWKAAGHPVAPRGQSVSASSPS